MHQCHRSLLLLFLVQYETKTSIRPSLTPLEEYNQSLDGGLNYDLTVPLNNSFMIYDACAIEQTS